jgi:hypothetical protein
MKTLTKTKTKPRKKPSELEIMLRKMPALRAEMRKTPRRRTAAELAEMNMLSDCLRKAMIPVRICKNAIVAFEFELPKKKKLNKA